MTKEDEIYPSVSLEIDSRVRELPSGNWFYEIRLHVGGPDDTFTRVSPGFSSKQIASEAMIISMKDSIILLLNEAFK